MNTYEQVFNLVWILLGIGICLHSLGLKLWVSSNPGSGLIPFLAGFIMGMVGLVRLVWKWRERSPQHTGGKFFDSPACRNRIFYVLIGFVAMAIFLPKLGFLLTSVIVTYFLLYVIEPQKFIKGFGIAIIACLFVYFLFVILLQVNLPKGFLGF